MWQSSKKVFGATLGKRQMMMLLLAENNISSKCLSTSVSPAAFVHRIPHIAAVKSQDVRHRSTYTDPKGKRVVGGSDKPHIQQQSSHFTADQVPIPDYEAEEKKVFRGLESDFPCIAKK